MHVNKVCRSVLNTANGVDGVQISDRKSICSSFVGGNEDLVSTIR